MKTQTAYEDCALTKQDYIDYAIFSLSVAEPCAVDILGDSAEALWEVFQGQSMCDQELCYLLIRLQLIKLVMGCYVWQVDNTHRTAGTKSSGVSSSQQDDWSQGQSTSQTSNFNDSAAHNRYDDQSRSMSVSSSWMLSNSDSHDERHSQRKDTGAGKASSNMDAERTTSSRSSGESESTTESNNDHAGSRSGCNYQWSDQAADGTANVVNAGIVGVGAAASSAGTVSKSNWDMFVSNSNQSSDNSEKHDTSGAAARSESTSSSEMNANRNSYFNALVDGDSTGTSQSKFRQDAESMRDGSSHADGEGSSASAAKSQGQTSRQGTIQGHGEGSTRRRSSRSGFARMDGAKAHQRFLHLRDLYDNTYELIEWRRHQLRAQIKPQVGQLLCDSLDGKCQVPAVIDLACRSLLCNNYPHRSFQTIKHSGGPWEYSYSGCC